MIANLSNSVDICILTGGGSHGSYAAGVLSKLYDNSQLKCDIVSGISVGALNAIPLVSKSIYNLSYIYSDIWMNIKRQDVFEYLPGLNHLLDTRPLRQTLNNFLNKYQLNVTKVPLYIGASSVTEGIFTEWRIPEEFSAKYLIDYVMASAAIPILFPMIEISSEYFSDGGLLRNIITNGPINEALLQKPSRINILIVSLRKNVTKVDLSELKNLIQVIVRTVSILYQNIGDVYLSCRGEIDVIATIYTMPETNCNIIDFDCCDELFKIGYTSTNVDVIKLC